MNGFFFIDDTLENRISYYHLALFLITLPLDAFYGDMVLISFAIHTFIHVRKGHLKLLVSKQVLLMSSLYLLTLAGILYTSNKEGGLVEISDQLPFLLFPVLLTLTNLNLEKYQTRLFKVFGVTCVVMTILMFANALQVIDYFHLPFSSLFQNQFINHNFSEPFYLHATFFAMYVAFSIVVFLFFFIKEKKIINKLFYGICLLILVAGLIQLSAKSVFFALWCIVFLAFPFMVLSRKTRIRFIITALIILIGAFFVIINVPSFNKRYIKELQGDLSQPSANNGIKEPRIVRWKAELQLIKRSPLIGYGTGSEKTELKNIFYDNKLYYCYLHEFNAHSQYLAFLITLGIAGFSIYCCILLYGFYVAIKTKNIFFISALTLITVVSIAEDIMTFSHGRMFYSFFIAFFLGIYQQKITTSNRIAEATLQ
jgi:O-antigen ligase